MLSKKYNALKPGSLTAEEHFFKRGDNEYLDAMPWTIGEISSENKGRQVFVNIQKVEEPRPKTFREARGQVIGDYQKILFESWMNQIKSKYPVIVNKEEVNRVMN